MSLNPILQLNLVTITGVMALFLVTLLVLRKTFFGPVLGVMLERDAKIEKGRRVREEGDRLVSDAQLAAERIWTESAVEQEKAVAAVKADIAASREARIARAAVDAEAILAAGRDEVPELRVSEQAKMRESLVTCVVETLSNMLETVDEHTVRVMVDKQLAEKVAEGPVT